METAAISDRLKCCTKCWLVSGIENLMCEEVAAVGSFFLIEFQIGVMSFHCRTLDSKLFHN
jgi:hypothetical protein